MNDNLPSDRFVASAVKVSRVLVQGHVWKNRGGISSSLDLSSQG